MALAGESVRVSKQLMQRDWGLRVRQGAGQALERIMHAQFPIRLEREHSRRGEQLGNTRGAVARLRGGRNAALAVGQSIAFLENDVVAEGDEHVPEKPESAKRVKRLSSAKPTRPAPRLRRRSGPPGPDAKQPMPQSARGRGGARVGRGSRRRAPARRRPPRKVLVRRAARGTGAISASMRRVSRPRKAPGARAGVGSSSDSSATCSRVRA